MTYVITAKVVLQGKNLEPLIDGGIVVEDDIIKFVGNVEDVLKQYPDVEKIKHSGSCLMPGMIDCHSHTSMDARVAGHLEMMNDEATELTLRAVRYQRDDLMSGITTSRILGDKNYVDVALRNAINRREAVGPRLLVAGIGMRSLHGHGFVGVPHTGVQEFRETSRKNMLRRTQWLKVFVTAGAPPVGDDHIPSFISLEEIEAVTREAKRMGIHTSAHCIGGEGLLNCVKGGIDVIDHAYCATDSDLKLIREQECWICLTPSVFMDLERNEHNTPAVAANTEAGRERVIATMRKIVASGVKYAIGSDALHGSMGIEAKYAVELGASVKDALLGITSRGAELCRINNITGCIQEGMKADVISLGENPLDKLEALKDVRLVMKDGEIFKNVL